MKKILYFRADWCGPCKTLGPIMDQISQEGILVQKIDVDLQSELTSKFGVRSIPSLIIVDSNDSILGRQIGYQSLEQIKNWWNSI